MRRKKRQEKVENGFFYLLYFWACDLEIINKNWPKGKAYIMAKKKFDVLKWFVVEFKELIGLFSNFCSIGRCFW